MPNYTGGMSICPFYQRESRLSIVCEGYCQEQQIGMKFRTEAEKLQWQQKYCLRFYYPRCPVAATVLWHYQDQENPAAQCAVPSREEPGCETIPYPRVSGLGANDGFSGWVFPNSLFCGGFPHSLIAAHAAAGH